MTILVIENDNKFRGALCSALTAIDSSVECITICDSENGLAMLNDGQVLPQLILIDLMMGKVNGVQFHYAVKGNPTLSTIPVWLLSSDILDTDLDFFERAGVKLFPKQHMHENLIASVELVLKDHRLRNPILPAIETANEASAQKLLQLQLNWR